MREIQSNSQKQYFPLTNRHLQEINKQTTKSATANREEFHCCEDEATVTDENLPSKTPKQSHIHPSI